MPGLAGWCRAAVDAAVVLTVRVAATEVLLLEIAAGWVIEHVGALARLVGETEQVSEMLPRKLPVGVTVTVEVAVAPGETAAGVVALRVKPEAVAAETLTETAVAAVMLPEVPLMATR